MRLKTLVFAGILLFILSCGNTSDTYTSQTDEEVIAETEATDTEAMGDIEPDMVYASHILIPFAGAASSSSTISMEEAEAFLHTIADSITAGELDFETAAARHSSCPSGQGGGSLGGFPRGAMVPEFEETAFNLAVGETSDVFQTNFGFHIVRRDPEPFTIRASHILLSYAGSMVQDPTVTRTKEEALEAITLIADSLDAGLIVFGKAAYNNSDCPSSEDGGDLGSFGEGNMVKEFADAAFSLEPGEISDIVETEFGYHIIQRTE